jgi:hypothetical protein
MVREYISDDAEKAVGVGPCLVPQQSLFTVISMDRGGCEHVCHVPGCGGFGL